MRSYRNTIEDKLIDLADRHKGARLSPDELRTLWAYHYAIKGRYEIVGHGGEVIDQWASGEDHLGAARRLRIVGRNPAYTARKRYIAVMKKIQKGRSKPD